MLRVTHNSYKWYKLILSISSPETLPECGECKPRNGIYRALSAHSLTITCCKLICTKYFMIRNDFSRFVINCNVWGCRYAISPPTEDIRHEKWYYAGLIIIFNPFIFGSIQLKTMNSELVIANSKIFCRFILTNPKTIFVQF